MLLKYWDGDTYIFMVAGIKGIRPIDFLFILFFKFFNVYLFLGQRETEHERGRVRERGRHRI